MVEWWEIVRQGAQLAGLVERVPGPVVVKADGREVFRGKVERGVQAIWNSLQERPDVTSVATAELHLKF